MKKSLLTILAALIVSMLESCIEDYNNKNVDDIIFNDSWLFIKADTNTASVIENSLLSGATVAGMEMVKLPHSPNIVSADGTEDWHGICFYQKKFTVPSKLRGKMVSLRFEGAMDVDNVWINGRQVVSNIDGYLPFVADFVPQDGENTVIIKLDNNDIDDCQDPKNLNFYGGIYRNVWLCANDSLSFTDEAEKLETPGGIFVSTSNISDGKGTVNVSANIRNAYSSDQKVNMVYKILDHNRKLIGKGSITRKLPANSSDYFKDSLTLSNITLWDIDNPWLYTLEAEIVEDGNIIDMEDVDFGFRTVSLNADGFVINGKKIKPLGVTRHQEYPYVGYAVSDQAQWRDAYKIKKAGFNFVRSCHYQQSESFLKACDYYGLMVLDPVLDTAICKGLIRRDRNHPCVLAWDVFPGRKHNVDSLVSFVKKLSSTEFPAGYCNVISSCPTPVTGKYIQTPIQSSESQQLQQTMSFVEVQNRLLDSLPMYGPCLAMFDHTESGSMDYSGLMSVNRRPKMSYYFYQSQSEVDNSELKAFSDPMCFIATYWIPNVSKGVTIFSNCSQVELFVDGQSVGKHMPINNSNTGNIPHSYFYFTQNCEKAGTLRAIAYSDDDEPLAESTVRTPSNPTRLKLVIDESGTLIAANDVVLVHCYILDKNNTVVPTADSEVEFTVNGTATLLSPSKIKAEAGVATALIRTGNSNNDFTISAKCGLMYTVADK